MVLSQKIIVGLVLALIGVFGVQQYRVDRANARTHTADLARVNAEAKVDTTRALDLKSIGDTLAVIQRLVVQTKQKADKVDRELGLQRVAVADVRAWIQGITVRDRAGKTTTNPDASKQTQFLVDEPPYHVDARVLHWSPQEPKLSLLDIRLDSARIQARLSCGERTGLVRSASLTLITSPWLKARIDSVSQSPEVCSPAPKGTRRLSLAVTLGYGAVVDSGRVHHGPGGTIGGSYRIW